LNNAYCGPLSSRFLQGRLFGSLIEIKNAGWCVQAKAEISDNDPDFRPFMGINSETISFPFGEARRQAREIAPRHCTKENGPEFPPARFILSST